MVGIESADSPPRGPGHLLGGRPVGSIALGGAGMSLSAERDDCVSITAIRAAADGGIVLFDTARAYTTVDAEAHNEGLFAEALGSREDVVIATKGGHFRIDKSTWGIDGSPEAIRADCERSLRRLRRERIELYFLHHPDPTVPLAESVGELNQLRSEGKVAHIGLSNVTIEQLESVQDVATVAAVENRFPATEAPKDGMAEHCASHGIVYLGYSPLSGVMAGLRAGRFPKLAEVAARLSVSPQRVTIAWLLACRPDVLPIVGASRPESVADSARAADLALTAQDLVRLSTELLAATPRIRIATEKADTARRMETS
ncbi:aldo/keto reductase [Microbacterium sp. X-17]|uniref:aldo/keto reductase n=1 Tax=Microbacterium sp. X-17 TaxID=3144404 RepID=UPI0031F532B8